MAQIQCIRTSVIVKNKKSVWTGDPAHFYEFRYLAAMIPWGLEIMMSKVREHINKTHGIPTLEGFETPSHFIHIQ